MNYITVLILILFCHYLADYPMQGILASMKQKSWWEKQTNYNNKYKYDYIPALIIHSFVWSFMIMLPLFIYQNFNMDLAFIIILILNTAIHASVDNAKANNKHINLIQDQLVHLLQIIWTSVLYF